MYRATFQLADHATGTSGAWIESNDSPILNVDPNKPPVARAEKGAKGLLSSMDVFYSMDAYMHARHECAVKAPDKSRGGSGSYSSSGVRVLKGIDRRL
jgi:hypothetical protein